LILSKEKTPLFLRGPSVLLRQTELPDSHR
jgi:hypothetical protein